MARNEQYIVGLDVGSSKVTAIVGEAMEDGSLEIVGTGQADAKGIRRGAIVNLEEAVDCIKRALDDAELMAGVDIDSVYLGLSGGHARPLNSRGVVTVSGAHREITRDDVRRAIDAAKAPQVPSGYEVLHVLPQDFVVDDQEQIIAPVGMTGSRLEVQTHIVFSKQSTSENVVASVNRAGVKVVDTVLEQLAAAEAVLTPDEKELGVAIVDVGHGITNYAIYERGSLWHTGSIEQGGELFTTDLAVGLRTPIADAERTKRRDGCAFASLVKEDQTIEVASVGGRQPRLVKRCLVATVLQPRAEEIFHMLSDEIRNAGFEHSLNAGIVLTGGGSTLEGMAEIAEQIFALPVRKGSPLGV
ncbi:MAG: cell division protein FtsA, partial [Acidobacteriota bacterium]|nr:cell division protein FtsA [Acidobacteriota bacterium]